MDCVTKLLAVDKKKGYIGSVIGLIVLIVCCTWYDWYVGAVFFAAFSVTGFIKFRIYSPKWTVALNIFGGFTVIAATWLCSMTVLDVVGRMGITFNRLLLNFLCILIVCFIFLILFLNWRIAVISGTFILVLLCVTNGFIYQFRGKELAPLDFLSLKTAVNVAAQYIPKLTHGMFYGIFIWFFAVFSQFMIPSSPKLSSMRTRMVFFSAGLFMTLFLFKTSIGIPIKLWDSQGTRINGYFLNFFLELRYSSVDKPTTYSPDKVKDIFRKHLDINEETIEEPEDVNEEPAGEIKNSSEETPEDVQIKIEEIPEDNIMEYPNIIVIMNESFADLSIVGEKFATDVPVTPFIKSLSENTVKGYALASVFGGNTANSEFEFLTGHSMKFLPENSVPYQQYIDDDIYSLPWVLRSYGYKCVSTHPYYENGWSRQSIYPRIGFHESSFLDNYPAPETVRDYVSDKETFKYILNYLQNDQDDKPIFMFGITMQNHGGYNYGGENFVSSIKLEGLEREYPDAEQYLSLTKLTDEAVEYLITELENFPENTIVLFFGDHFPGLSNEFYEEIHGGTFDSLDEYMLLYSVPFFVWANYDIPEDSVACTSLNYLPVRLMKLAGITLSPFYKFLDSCEKLIPAFNIFGMYSVANEAFLPFSEASPVEWDWLEEYSVLQYNNLIDVKNRDDNFKHDEFSIKPYTTLQ